MAILFDSLSILLPAAVLENCLETSGLNPSVPRVPNWGVLIICSIGIFSDRETLELLTVSLSYENLLPRLTFTCFCFVCGTVPHVFIYDYRKCRRLPEPHFFLLGECHPLSNVRTATHVLQFSSGTVPLNFVWLSHNALSLTINLLIVSFSFVHYPYFV